MFDVSHSPRIVADTLGPDGRVRSQAPWNGPGTITVGGLSVETRTSATAGAGSFEWAVRNVAATEVTLVSIAVVFTISPARLPARVFRNGWQSWSRSRVIMLGEEDDPSRHEHSLEIGRQMYAADAGVAPERMVRSDMVTVIDAGVGGHLVCVGFDGGDRHDGVILVQPAVDESGIEVAATAWFGATTCDPGQERVLHTLRSTEGDDPSALLAGWAAHVGPRAGARTKAPFQAGWCSWYHYFFDVTERDVLANLERSGEWPFAVFQVDDGFQSAVGDWLTTNEKFPSGLAALPERIAAAGSTPGLWLAPFFAAPDSQLASEHPDWLVRAADGDGPAIGMVNPGWGGLVHVLDTTHPAVLAHLHDLAAELVGLGFDYLKLDFLYGASIAGRHHDRSLSPAQRLRIGLDAIRSGAAEDTFLLGCGAPLGASIGVVDGMRIGPDVAPVWESGLSLPGFEEECPATKNAWRNTLTRSFMHRRFWLNDPDCVMLRRTQTGLAPPELEAWADAVAASGGMVIVSDDLALLDDESHALLERTIAAGRLVDAAASAGDVPRCGDLMDSPLPANLTSGPAVLTADTSKPVATLELTSA